MLKLHRYDAALKWNSALKIPDKAAPGSQLIEEASLAFRG